MLQPKEPIHQLNNVAKAPSEHVIRRCVVLFREFGNVNDRHRYLSFYPYKVQIVQSISPSDFEARLHLARRFVEVFGSGDSLSSLMMTGTFHLQQTKLSLLVI